MNGLSGALETAIMEVLWTQGPMSGRELHAEIGRQKGVAYTTARTVLDRLSDKGLVKKDRASGMITFSPRISRQDYQSAVAENLAQSVFDASPDLAVSAFAGLFSRMSRKELDRLERLIKEKKSASERRRP